MKPSGAHTHPESGGPGWLLLAIVLIVIAVGGSAGHAADHALHTVGEMLEVAVITVLSAIGVALAGGVTFGIIKLRRHLRQSQLQAPPRITVRQVAEPVESAARTGELEQRLARIEALLLSRDQPAERVQAIKASPTAPPPFVKP
jgi:hypothetical protein